MKTRIFIETSRHTTSEYVFIDTLLKAMGKSQSSYEIQCVGGKDNLRNLENKFLENTLEGGCNIIIFDADSPETGSGFEASRERILHTFSSGIKIDGLFLFPDNHSDGIFENLLVALAQKKAHARFFDCFSDYEKCLGEDYVSPDIKGKLHTYMSAQKALTKKQHDLLGSGQWLFDDTRFWNLDSEAIQPLKRFLEAYVV